MNILVSWVKIGVWSDTFTYKAETMCTTRFGSQGLILDDFFKQKKIEEKKTLVERETPPPPSWKTPLNIFVLFFWTLP